jgi:hypothetical protein
MEHMKHSIGGAVCAPKRENFTWLDSYRKPDEPPVCEVTAISRNMLFVRVGGGSVFLKTVIGSLRSIGKK